MKGNNACQKRPMSVTVKQITGHKRRTPDLQTSIEKATLRPTQRLIAPDVVVDQPRMVYVVWVEYVNN